MSSVDGPVAAVALVSMVAAWAATIAAASPQFRSALLQSAEGFAFAAFLLFMAWPYVVVVWVSRRNGAWRLWARISGALYGLLEVGTRLQVILAPGGSTDAIAFVTLPMVGAPVVFVFAGAVAWIWRTAQASRKGS